MYTFGRVLLPAAALFTSFRSRLLLIVGEACELFVEIAGGEDEDVEETEEAEDKLNEVAAILVFALTFAAGNGDPAS